MKLNTLIFGDKTYDFSNKVAGASVVTDISPDELKNAFVCGLYGEADFSRYSLPLSLEFVFGLEDVDYVLARKFEREPNGDVAKFATLKKADGTTVAEGAEAVNAFIAEKTLPLIAFEKLFFLDKAEAAAVAGETAVRESFVAEKLNAITTAKEVTDRWNNLKAEEAALIVYMDGVKPVTRDEIKAQEIKADSDRLALEALRNQIDELNKELAYADKYQEELNEFYDATARLESLDKKKDEMYALAERADASNRTRAIMSAYQTYRGILGNIDEIKSAINDGKIAIAELEKKSAAGTKSLEMLGDEFVRESLREVELNKAFLDMAGKGSSAGIATLDNVIDGYYSEYDQKKKLLSDRKAALDSQFDTLSAACAELTEKKLAIRLAADYKKAVQDGAMLGQALADGKAAAANAEARIEALNRERANLSEENKSIVERLQKLRKEASALDAAIKGKYATQEDAVNAEVIFKQTIYSKHLFVSTNEVELDAVRTKIEAVKKSSASYAVKRDELIARQKEVEAHKAKLEEKLALLNEKLNEYVAYNRLKEIADTVEYGSRCPVCDGFVSTRKEMPARDLKPVQNQIDAVNADIAKDAAAIVSAAERIGKYEAAAKVSEQYLASLIETADNKQRLISEVLKEYGASDIPDLFARARAAVETGKEMTRNIDRFRLADAEIRKFEEANAKILDRIRKIDSEDLPAETAAMEAGRQKAANADAELERLRPYFKGEDVNELLLKLQVVEKEYEATEASLEEKEALLNEVAAERSEVAAEIDLIASRAMKITLNGTEYDYKRVVEKAYSDFIIAFNKELEKVKEKKETLKIRIQGVRKVADDINKELLAAREKLTADMATAAAIESTANKFYSEYEPKFAELGINSEADIDRLLLPAEEVEKYQNAFLRYDEDVASAKDAVARYSAGVAAHAGYYEKRESNLLALESLKREEENAVITLAESVKLKNDMVSRYEKLIASNKKLSFIQARIKGTDDLRCSLCDGDINVAGVAKQIAERASAIVKTVTQGRYFTETADNGSLTLVLSGKGRVKAEKATREEKILVPLSAAAAFNGVMTALLAGDLVPIIKLDAAECDKASLAPVIEFSKVTDVIVAPDDEVMFFKSVSKLN